MSTLLGEATLPFSFLLSFLNRTLDLTVNPLTSQTLLSWPTSVCRDRFYSRCLITFVHVQFYCDINFSRKMGFSLADRIPKI